MTGPVMVPLDGSAVGHAARARALPPALPPALALARTFDAPVALVRVFDLPRAASGGDHPPGSAAAGDALADEARAELEALAARVRALGVPCTAAVVRTAERGASDAEVARALLAHAARTGAAVVVMATRAAGALSRALLGSVADAVVHAAPVPVVLVPPTAAAAPGDAPAPVRRVLVPLDASPHAARALDVLAGWPGLAGMTVSLLRAVVPLGLLGFSPPEAMLDVSALADEEAEAGTALEAAAARLRALGATVTTHVETTADPAGAIADAARETGADLVVMGARGLGGMARLTLGSVTDAVVRRSPRPVVIVRER